MLRMEKGNLQQTLTQSGYLFDFAFISNQIL
jgi:hypothetical protein